MAEGPKVVSEFLDAGFEIHSLYAVEDYRYDDHEFESISEKELHRISNLKSPNQCLAVFKQPSNKSVSNSGLIVALDAVRDPGNLGTIIRLCDWFGITTLWCSEDTTDCYNPKVVQSTMGSLARVTLSYLDLEAALKASDSSVYGAVMDGSNVYEYTFPENGILLMGNESHGISNNLEQLLDHRITIPRFGKLKQTESLNVATATAILLSEFKRPTGR